MATVKINNIKTVIIVQKLNNIFRIKFIRLEMGRLMIII